VLLFFYWQQYCLVFEFYNFIEYPYFNAKDRLQAREIENLRLNYALLNKKMDQINGVIEAIEDRDNLYRVYFNAIPDSLRGRFQEKTGIRY
jgi:hypothetical protein